MPKTADTTQKDPFSTPMMKQYAKIKKQYKDCILFFRLGDFYEMFLDDAKVGAEVLDITLTSRDRGKDGRVPMAGVPYHAAESYLSKLVKSGYKVAICEQLTEPDGKGIVERGVVRVVTPGTILENKALNRSKNNFVGTLAIIKKTLGITLADLSTGKLLVDETEQPIHKYAKDFFGKFPVAELVLPKDLYENTKILNVLNEACNTNIFSFSHVTTRPEDVVKDHFNLTNLEAIGFNNKTAAIDALAFMISYLAETQKTAPKNINKLDFIDNKNFVSLDHATIKNLELFSTVREGTNKGTLLETLDSTKTAMGSRLLKDWLVHPLRSKTQINNRLDEVETLLKERKTRQEISEILKEIKDIERLLSKIVLGVGNAREMVVLKNSLEYSVAAVNKYYKIKKQQSTNKDILKTVEDLINIVSSTILDNPNVELKQGNLIKPHNNIQLDKLQQEIATSKEWITNLEKQEKERLGITSLKVKFNKVFGYYIEISNSYLDKVPEQYQRKQTLVNAERFFTDELKRHEEIILTAEEKTNQIEYEIYLEVVQEIVARAKHVQHLANIIAQIDVFCCFADTAEKHNYTKPNIIKENKIELIKARHPVVERTLNNRQFVPNDILLDTKQNQLLLITGPNMAGKSVLIRQVAVITLMAQIGCFVPAQTANINPTDKVFVRSGASDMISGGLSTFMVEMTETANILNNATNQSLIVMDEIGRGTSTYDGISIAWSIAEFLLGNNVDNIRPKTLFATHYHELEQLEHKVASFGLPQGVKNFQMAVHKDKNTKTGDPTPIFLYKLVRGGAEHSFGIQVAKMAGIPNQVVSRATKILADLETKGQINNDKKVEIKRK